jgi:hypothetical protein
MTGTLNSPDTDRVIPAQAFCIVIPAQTCYVVVPA